MLGFLGKAEPLADFDDRRFGQSADADRTQEDTNVMFFRYGSGLDEVVEDGDEERNDTCIQKGIGVVRVPRERVLTRIPFADGRSQGSDQGTHEEPEKEEPVHPYVVNFFVRWYRLKNSLDEW